MEFTATVPRNRACKETVECERAAHIVLDFITEQLVSMNLDAVLDVDKALVFMHLPYRDVKLGCQRFLGDDGVLDMIVLPFRQGHTLR